MTLKEIDNISLSEVKFLSKKTVEKLKERGIKTVKDLIFFFPYRYEDLTKITKIKDIKIGEKVVIVGRVSNVKVFPTPKKRMFIVQGIINDETGSLRVVWYNQPYLAKMLSGGALVRLIGTLRKSSSGLQFQPEKTEIIPDKTTKIEKKILPIYTEISGLRSKYLEKIIQKILDFYEIEKVKDIIPEWLRKKYNLMSLGQSLKSIHQPKSLLEAEMAKESISFQEMFLIEIALMMEKNAISKAKAPIIELKEESLQKFLSQFDFSLTDGQRKVLSEIFNDLKSGKPMNRLLQGEVGSGKTLIAEIISLGAMESGYQVVFMAPTEILAFQHFQRLKNDFRQTDFVLALITKGHSYIAKNGFQAYRSEEYLFKLIELGEIKFIIGTHALIENPIKFKNVGLVIIDEQQRFGVEQRKKLLSQTSQNFMPHFLSMTATPIPRTLSLALYGDLDLSILEEKPFGRKEVKTYLVTKEKEELMWKFVKKEIEKGHQIFVICPRVEIEEDDEIASVKKEYEEVKKIFPEVNIGILYGKMKSEEKAKILKSLELNEIKILVSSSVVEVGIDLPLATVIIIDGAEKFGLSQLHQLRGRVGRSIHQSYCFLKVRKWTPKIKARIVAFLKAKSALELAEKDLEIRGPGELLGKNQSGIPDFAMESLKNLKFIQKVRSAVDEYLKVNPDLKFSPLIKEEIDKIRGKIFA